MYFTYIIQSLKNFRYYIGYTKDLERRLAEHNHNNTRSLYHKGPFKIVYYEKFTTIQEARAGEKQYLHPGSGGNLHETCIMKPKTECGLVQQKNKRSREQKSLFHVTWFMIHDVRFSLLLHFSHFSAILMSAYGNKILGSCLISHKNQRCQTRD